VVHPVKRYAIENGLFFVDVPHERRWPKDLKDLRTFIAQSRKVDVFNEEASGEKAPTTRQIRPEEVPSHFDVGVVVSFRYLVPQFIVQQFKVGAFNIHPSDLPKYRGPAPLVWTLANGEHSTRISFIQLFSKFDHGTVVHQSPPIEIPSNEMYASLYSRIAKTSAEMSVHFINGHSKEELKKLLQPCESAETLEATDYIPASEKHPFAPKINQEKHCFVSFHDNTSTEILNKFRAFSQHWNLHTTVHGKTLYIHKMCPITDTEELEEIEQKFSSVAAPGEVIFNKKRKNVYVQCADGQALTLQEVQYAGRRQTNSEGFAAGLSLRHNQRKLLTEK